MKGYDLHPEAHRDLDEIAEDIGDNSPDATKRVVAEIFNAIAALCHFRIKAIAGASENQGRKPGDQGSAYSADASMRGSVRVADAGRVEQKPQKNLRLLTRAVLKTGRSRLRLLRHSR